jgi:hypothetical protein
MNFKDILEFMPLNVQNSLLYLLIEKIEEEILSPGRLNPRIIVLKAMI